MTHRLETLAAVAALFAVTLLPACRRPEEKPATGGAETPAVVGSLSFLALGDSYTIGQGVEPRHRWPVLLASMLRDRGVDLSDPYIIARTGWTVAELSAGVDAEESCDPKQVGGGEAESLPQFDLVTLLIGVNDQYRGGTPEQYRPQFAAMLERAIDLAGEEPSRVIVLSIPDWGVTPFARIAGRDPKQVGREIDAFNAVNREESARAGVRYVDVTPVSREAASQPDLLAGDGLHPSGLMYERWADLVLPEAAAALSPPPAGPSGAASP